MALHTLTFYFPPSEFCGHDGAMTDEEGRHRRLKSQHNDEHK